MSSDPVHPHTIGPERPVDTGALEGSDLHQPAHRLRRIHQVAGSSTKAVLRPHGLRSVAREAAVLGVHTVAYPLGWLEEKARDQVERHTLEGLPPVQRGLMAADVVAAGTPIILLHGVIDNRSIFALLRRGLKRRGFGRMVAFNYSVFTRDIRSVAARLADVVERVVRETGYERVHIIGHSMGGLIARYYTQVLNGDHRVHTLVTLGTPHGGSKAARLVPHPIARQMRPGSDIICEMGAPAPDCPTRFVAIWSDMDAVIIPKANARILHQDLNARNVFFSGLGHMSLPVNGRVVHEISATLAHLDQEGHVVADGATSISSATGRSARLGLGGPRAANPPQQRARA